ncbi:hypothetical protein AB0M46_03030 [Dactylosporangium sp. NPDC051485]|uniref:hypothetical protein n=1 Tax=Dactylosporangium sp. NPDC051485 TaxID=3154846 RepID=UPI00343F0DF1
MTNMLEDELRATFAAKAGSPPPGSVSALHGAADAAIAGALRVRRRRRAAVTGLSGFVAVAAVSVAVLHTLTAGGPAGPPQAGGSIGRPQTEQRPSAGTTNFSSPTQAAMHEVEAIGPSAQAATRVRLQLPAASTVTAAYQARDGYLVVNTQPDGDKQLLLQDDTDQQQVLVDNANDIAVAKDGNTVAWAEQGKMYVGSRAGGDGKRDDTKKITKKTTADVPQDTQPVAFVGTNLVMSNGDKGFDVWQTERRYDPTWDNTVVRVFGGTADNSGVYAELTPVDPDTPMCLALLKFGQPFTIQKQVCGLPVAAKVGGRISPDGRWLAYPVAGLKQVAMLDLAAVFTAAGAKPKLWTLTVTTKTVWLNATTFVVDNGKKFLKLNPAAGGADPVPLDQDPGQETETAQVVLIEPLEGP